MRIITTLSGLLLALFLAWGISWLSQPQQRGGKPLPAIGPLLSPQYGFWQNAERLQTKARRKIEANGRGEVVFDERMVPHVFAASTEDALYMQGYVTAAHRLFQMDISSRSAGGRLSEILGERSLARDKEERRKGMLFAAENAVEAWKRNPDASRYLSAYVEGVNAYINSLSPAEYPLEYKLIGAAPEPWTMLKSALFVKAMAADLAERQHDVEATNALHRWGRDTFDFLFPEYFLGETPIVPAGKRWPKPTGEIPAAEADQSLNAIDYYDWKAYRGSPKGVGSNNWAVSAAKSATGAPMLCGDPHLALRLPSIWYEIQLHSPELNAYGVSLPGLPFVIIGFNENIAWSQTNVGHDVADLYRIKWKDDTKMEYLLDGEYKAVDLRVEEYQVKGKGVVRDTVRYTVWGPLRYDSPNSADKDLAYRWLAHDGSDAEEILTFLKMNQASSFDEFYKALDTYDVPAQNFAFASRQGDIAIRIAGKFPVKAEGQGRFVRDGSRRAAGWDGYIPMEEVPLVKNPIQGYVASANQHSTTPDYPYYYNKEYFESFRGRILNRFLSEGDSLDVRDMMDFQNSNYDLKAEEALPLMLAALPASIQSAKKGLVGMLSDWDYVYRPDSRAATFFNAWFAELYLRTWDEMRADSLPPMLLPTELRTIQLMREAPGSSFFDEQSSEKVERFEDMALLSFLETEAYFSDSIPEWSDYQSPTIRHIAQIPAFSVAAGHLGGVNSALNAQTSTHGPSWRQIVVLGERPRAFVCYPGGQSGNPGSPHYRNFIDTWAKGEYYPALFMENSNSNIDGALSRWTF